MWLIGAEHAAQVAETGGTEQRIAQRMCCDVTIGVSGAAVRIVEQQAQQPTRPPPRLNGMNVGTQTDARQFHV